MASARMSAEECDREHSCPLGPRASRNRTRWSYMPCPHPTETVARGVQRSRGSGRQRLAERRGQRGGVAADGEIWVIRRDPAPEQQGQGERWADDDRPRRPGIAEEPGSFGVTRPELHTDA